MDIELFTENGAGSIGAKHKLAQSYLSTGGVCFSRLKDQYLSRLSTKYYNLRATASLPHFMLKVFCATLRPVCQFLLTALNNGHIHGAAI